MATKAEIKKRALQMLGVTRIGQAAQSQDDTRIDTAYTEVYNELKQDGRATWAIAGPVPSEVTQHVAALMAFNASLEYGISRERYARLAALRELANREIPALTTPDYESLEEPDDY